MKVRRIALAALALSAATAWAEEQSAVQHVTRSTTEVANKAGHGIEDLATRTGTAVKGAARRTGEAIGRVSKKVTDAVAPHAAKVEHAIKPSGAGTPPVGAAGKAPGHVPGSP